MGAMRRAIADGLTDGADARQPRFRVDVRSVQQQICRRRGGDAIDGVQQRRQPFRGRGGHQHHRTAKLRGQLIGIQLDAARSGDIGHIKHHDHRQVQLAQLQGEPQALLQARRVDHVDQHVRLAAHHIAAGDALVGGEPVFGLHRFQRIDAGQIDQRDGSLAGGEGALLALDGDAGPVAGALAQPGQQIEQRGFTGVRVARQYGVDTLHACSPPSTASRRSIASSALRNA